MLVAYRQAVGRFQSALRHITGASVRLPFVVQTHLSCLPDVACGVLLDGLNVSLQAAGEAPMPIRTVLIALSLLIAVACAQVDPTPAPAPTLTPTPAETPTPTPAPTETPEPTPTPAPTLTPEPTSEPTVCDAEDYEHYERITREVASDRPGAFIALGGLLEEMGRDADVTTTPRWYSEFEEQLLIMETWATMMLQIATPRDGKLRNVHHEFVRSAELMLEALPLTKRGVDQLNTGMLGRANALVSRSVDHLRSASEYGQEWSDECE